jgi:hypothetical protein
MELETGPRQNCEAVVRFGELRLSSGEGLTVTLWRRHDRGPPLGELLGGQLKRRRPVRLCSLEVQAHPVTRQDLDPPLRE